MANLWPKETIKNEYPIVVYRVKKDLLGAEVHGKCDISNTLFHEC